LLGVMTMPLVVTPAALDVPGVKVAPLVVVVPLPPGALELPLIGVPGRHCGSAQPLRLLPCAWQPLQYCHSIAGRSQPCQALPTCLPFERPRSPNRFGWPTPEQPVLRLQAQARVSLGHAVLIRSRQTDRLCLEPRSNTTRHDTAQKRTTTQHSVPASSRHDMAQHGGERSSA
jgi:hypothetical protein